MRTICATLLATAAIASVPLPNIEDTTLPPNVKKAMNYQAIDGVNNLFVRTDLSTGWIDNEICTNDCWNAYLDMMRQESLKGDYELKNIIHGEWDSAGWKSLRNRYWSYTLNQLAG